MLWIPVFLFSEEALCILRIWLSLSRNAAGLEMDLESSAHSGGELRHGLTTMDLLKLMYLKHEWFLHTVVLEYVREKEGERMEITTKPHVTVF